MKWVLAGLGVTFTLMLSIALLPAFVGMPSPTLFNVAQMVCDEGAPVTAAQAAASYTGKVQSTGSGGLPANYKVITDYLQGHGYTAIAAAGIAGNIQNESGGDPEKLQIGGGGGGGLIQWTPWQKAGNIITGNKLRDLNVQLAAILTFNNAIGQAAIHELNTAGDAGSAAIFYESAFEHPASASDAGARAASARLVYAAIKGKNPQKIGNSDLAASQTIEANCVNQQQGRQNSGIVASGHPSGGPIKFYGDNFSQASLDAIYGPMGTNLVTINFQGHPAQVNKRVAGMLVAIDNAVTAAHITTAHGGSYAIKEFGCYRNSVGTSNGLTYSLHQAGVACDINWDTNPFSSSGAPMAHDMPAGIIKAFGGNGWHWGGSWTSPKDYMHFEYQGG